MHCLLYSLTIYISYALCITLVYSCVWFIPISICFWFITIKTTDKMCLTSCFKKRIKYHDMGIVLLQSLGNHGNKKWQPGAIVVDVPEITFQEYKTHNTTKYTLFFAIPSKIPYSGKFSLGSYFRDFADCIRSRENKNRNNLFQQKI